jgi:hypothetical protein
MQETKCMGEEASSTLQKYWNQDNHMEVDAKGVAGGLEMLWNTSIVLLDGFYTSKWTITTSFHLIGLNKLGYITNVYEPTRLGDKESFLNHLDWISNHIAPQIWILMGYFNILTGLEEKRRAHALWEMTTSISTASLDS